MFGDNIKDNIFIMITFADGHEPPVLKTLENAKVPYKTSFIFNNSALFSPRTSRIWNTILGDGEKQLRDVFRCPWRHTT